MAGCAGYEPGLQALSASEANLFSLGQRFAGAGVVSLNCRLVLPMGKPADEAALAARPRLMDRVAVTLRTFIDGMPQNQVNESQMGGLLPGHAV